MKGVKYDLILKNNDNTTILYENIEMKIMLDTIKEFLKTNYNLVDNLHYKINNKIIYNLMTVNRYSNKILKNIVDVKKHTNTLLL